MAVHCLLMLQWTVYSHVLDTYSNGWHLAKEAFHPDKIFAFPGRGSLVIVGREITDSLDTKESCPSHIHYSQTRTYAKTYIYTYSKLDHQSQRSCLIDHAPYTYPT